MTNLNITPEFLLGGKALFTVNNSAEHFTYKVKSKEFNGREYFFVSIFVGTDNTSDYHYRYAGKLNPATMELEMTAGSKFSESDLSVKVLKWAIAQVKKGSVPEGYEVRHDGRCGRCTRKLTNPKSLTTGIGPECRKHMAA